MAGKSLYKRAIDPWCEDVKFSPRAKENKMLLSDVLKEYPNSAIFNHDVNFNY